MDEIRMEGLKTELLDLIRNGKENAIKGRHLAEACGYRNDRVVRLAIGELIQDGHPIASSTESPAGYYFATTISEVEEYARSLRARVRQDAIRRRDFLRASRSILQPGQLRMRV
tara:strand:- start:47 stop:388 length:342 start_codon:yes stop_codon:yes gene_type:complete